MSSLEFLNMKSFHPGTKENQKKLFIAEQKASANEKRERERAKERQDEIEFYKNKAALGRQSKMEAERSKVSFLYAAPPGATLEKEKTTKTNNDSNSNRSPENEKKDIRQMTDTEKFPFLANAPVQGDYTSDIKVTHKPFGIELRDVRCIRCQQWGHKSGDRDCPLKDVNPNDLKRLQREDPLFSMSTDNQQGDNNDDEDDDSILREFLESLSKKQRKLLLRQIKKEEKQKKKKDKNDKEKVKEKDKRKRKRKNNKDYNSSSSSSSESDNDYSSNDNYSSDSEDDKSSHRKNKSTKRSHHKEKDHRKESDDEYVERKF